MTKKTVKVYLFDEEKNAEFLFKEFVNRTDNGGKHQYKWTGKMGVFDLDDDRIYFMTYKHRKEWEKTFFAPYSEANGDGVIKGILKKK